ncbi:MAG: diacylglycerol kinase family protein [Flavobacteriales bacterium]|nr:diacylglycerol kinase family protein [Flavobacteriales bacterium]
MVMTKILIIVNPHSGTHSKEDVLRTLEDFAKNTSLCKIEVVLAQTIDESQKLVRRAIREKYYAVVVVGGDGTANSVGKLLCGTQTALGIIPAGSGNGVARHIGMSLSIKKALEQILMSHVYDVDTLDVNGHFCLGVAGVGFEAVVADSFSHRDKRGLISYSAVAIQEFFKYSAPALNMNIDGQEIDRKPFTLAFANSSQWGNDFKIAPKASMTSGTIKTVIISDIDQINVMACVATLLSGTINTLPNCETLNASNVAIHSPNMLFHIDGEPMGRCDTLEISVKPSSLKLLSPKKKI